MTTILKSLTLDAYRGITGLKLEGLTQFNLLVGANNAGKSSILEAAALLLRPVDALQWVDAVRHRDADLSLMDGLWSMFPGSEALHPEDGTIESQPIRLSAETQDTDEQRTVMAQCIVSQGSGLLGTANVEVSVNGQPELRLKFPPRSTPSHQVPLYRVFIVTPFAHYSSYILAQQLSAVVKLGKKELAVQLLSLFDPEVEDLDIANTAGAQLNFAFDAGFYDNAFFDSPAPAEEKPPRGTSQSIFVTHKSRGIVNLSSFGDGMRRSVALALALTRASQGVLLVDELEAGIHPSVLGDVMAKLLQAARESQVQILATTHSLETLDAVMGAATDNGNGKELTTFYLKREDGPHKVFRYDQERLATLREGGLDIR